MSTGNTWSEEQVHAFVDGELAPGDAAALRAAMQADARLAARITRQQALRARLADTFDPVLGEPLPERLLQAMDGRTAVATPIGAARRAAPSGTRPRPLWWAAAAASVMGAALIGWSLPRIAGGDFTQRDGALLASGDLADALNTHLSAAVPAGKAIGIPLSFRATDGRYCRAFSLASGTDGVACRDADGWRIEAMGHGNAGTASAEYRQAASSLSAAVAAAISGAQEGDALSIEEERHAREGDWR